MTAPGGLVATEDGSAVMLVLLWGIPAAGKSTLTRALERTWTESVDGSYHAVRFDDVFRERRAGTTDACQRDG